MPAALLDVNILIALFDAAHPHHQLVHDWFSDHRHRGWATCPLTQNALLRILSNPAYGSNAERPGAIASRLQALCAADDHRFWPNTISLLDANRFDLSAAGHRHLTDIYLAGLAHANGGRLATLDRSIPVRAVVGAGPGTLEVIRP